MESMAISEFKATCLAVLERVRRTKRPVLITRFGQPVAEVVPPSAAPPAQELDRFDGGHRQDPRRYRVSHRQKE
jgi:prevent-host-death family protein